MHCPVTGEKEEVKKRKNVLEKPRSLNPPPKHPEALKKAKRTQTVPAVLLRRCRPSLPPWTTAAAWGCLVCVDPPTSTTRKCTRTTLARKEYQKVRSLRIFLLLWWSLYFFELVGTTFVVVVVDGVVVVDDACVLTFSFLLDTCYFLLGGPLVQHFVPSVPWGCPRNWKCPTTRVKAVAGTKNVWLGPCWTTTVMPR